MGVMGNASHIQRAGSRDVLAPAHTGFSYFMYVILSMCCCQNGWYCPVFPDTSESLQLMVLLRCESDRIEWSTTTMVCGVWNVA